MAYSHVEVAETHKASTVLLTEMQISVLWQIQHENTHKNIKNSETHTQGLVPEFAPHILTAGMWS